MSMRFMGWPLLTGLLAVGCATDSTTVQERQGCDESMRRTCGITIDGTPAVLQCRLGEKGSPCQNGSQLRQRADLLGNRAGLLRRCGLRYTWAGSPGKAGFWTVLEACTDGRVCGEVSQLGPACQNP